MMMDSVSSVFFFGKCPCCDRIITIPSGTTKTYCCYCGSQFLSSAAITLYGSKEKAVISANYKAEVKPIPPKESVVKIERPDPSSVPKMMTVTQLCKATGISQYAIRRLLKQGKFPAFYSGNKALINYTKICEILDSLE
jgi:excisionase family DNA binding protein